MRYLLPKWNLYSRQFTSSKRYDDPRDPDLWPPSCALLSSRL